MLAGRVRWILGLDPSHPDRIGDDAGGDRVIVLVNRKSLPERCIGHNLIRNVE